jgi:hypothetical protein
MSSQKFGRSGFSCSQFERWIHCFSIGSYWCKSKQSKRHILSLDDLSLIAGGMPRKIRSCRGREIGLARLSGGQGKPRASGNLAELGQVRKCSGRIAAVESVLGPVGVKPDPGQSGLDFRSHELRYASRRPNQLHRQYEPGRCRHDYKQGDGSLRDRQSGDKNVVRLPI